MNERAKELIKELGAKKAKKGVAWKNYEVFIPVYASSVTIGLPLVVFQNGVEARVSSADEALEYLDYELKMKKSK